MNRIQYVGALFNVLMIVVVGAAEAEQPAPSALPQKQTTIDLQQVKTINNGIASVSTAEQADQLLSQVKDIAARQVEEKTTTKLMELIVETMDLLIQKKESLIKVETPVTLSKSELELLKRQEDKVALCKKIQTLITLTDEDKDALFSECIQAPDAIVPALIELWKNPTLYENERYPGMINFEAMPEELRSYIANQPKDRKCLRVTIPGAPQEKKNEAYEECMSLPNVPGLIDQWIALKNNEKMFRQNDEPNTIDINKLPEPLRSYILAQRACLVTLNPFSNNMYGQPHPFAQELAETLFNECNALPYDYELRSAWIDYYYSLPHSFFVELTRAEHGPHRPPQNLSTMIPDMNFVPEKLREFLRTQDREVSCKRCIYLPFVTDEATYNEYYKECLSLPQKLDIVEQWLAFQMRPYHFSKDMDNKVVYADTLVEPLASFLKQQKRKYTIIESSKIKTPNRLQAFLSKVKDGFKKTTAPFRAVAGKVIEAFKIVGRAIQAKVGALIEKIQGAPCDE